MSKLQAQFTNYMLKALTNDSIDYFRAIKNNWKTKDVEFVNIDDYEVLVSQDCDTEASFFIDNYFEDITDENLVMGIKSLSDMQKEILKSHINGESEKSIAKRFNVSVGTVKKSLARSRNKIKKYRKD